MRKLRSIFVVVLLCIVSAEAFAQEYKLTGRLLASDDNSALIGANLVLTEVRTPDNQFYAVADANGNFTFEGLSKTFYSLEVSYVGYARLKKFVRIVEQATSIGEVKMQPEAKLLDEVKVVGETPAAIQKGDTTAFNADAYKTNPDADAADLIRKMPGITIENGTVNAQGEDVQRVLVDGREFFGNDPQLALRSLPAEVIERIEVFDRASDQSQFTGFDDGNSQKTINIVTRSNLKTSQFGKVYGGYGTDDRYLAGALLNIFNETQRISLIGMSNNISDQNFSTQDLLGVVGTSNQRRSFTGGGGGIRFAPGGGGGGRRFGRGNSVNNFLVGTQNGITQTHSFGLNFSDEWGENLKLSGSYFFNNSDNTNREFVNQEIFLVDGSSQFYEENNFTTSNNTNHRLNMRLEYSIDESNSLIYTPSINFQNNESYNELGSNTFIDPLNPLNQSINITTSNTSGYNISNNLLLRHRFEKRGRTISLNARTSFNDSDGSTILESENQFFAGGQTQMDSLFQETIPLSDGYTLSGNLNYTEPLGQGGQLQLTYNASLTNSQSDRRTMNYSLSDDAFTELDTALSNTFESDYITHRAGASYRLRLDGNKLFMTAGLSYQHAEITGDRLFPTPTEVNRSFTNLLPNAMLMYRISEKQNLRIFYRSRTNAPSISQLQDVVDNSNPTQLSSGNPNLDQTTDHIALARYSLTDPLTSRSFFLFFFVRKTGDYIGNSTIIADQDMTLSNGAILNRGSQFSNPVNLDGYWNARSFLTYGFPVKLLKSNLNLSTSYTYNRTPGLINNAENISDSHTITQGLVLASNISEKVDFTLSYSGNFNTVDNSIQPELDNDYFFHNAGLNLNLIVWKGIVIRSEMSNYIYRGLSDEFNEDFLIWNVSLGKKLFKDQNAEIKLSVFDILKENQSIVRNVTETYVEDVRTEVLQQYFMLSFTYNLRKFGKSSG